MASGDKGLVKGKIAQRFYNEFGIIKTVNWKFVKLFDLHSILHQLIRMELMVAKVILKKQKGQHTTAVKKVSYSGLLSKKKTNHIKR